MLAAFLGIYLRPITSVQWTEILDSLYGTRVPARVGEPWKFVATTESTYEPMPTVEATSLAAILAAKPTSTEYPPLADRFCTLRHGHPGHSSRPR
jgi:hypothetical protein